MTEVEPYEVEIDLGGADCELCGWTPESLRVEQDGDDWAAYLRVGCYGADSFRGAREDVILWLQEEAGWAVSAADMKGLIADIRAA